MGLLGVQKMRKHASSSGCMGMEQYIELSEKRMAQLTRDRDIALQGCYNCAMKCRVIIHYALHMLGEIERFKRGPAQRHRGVD